MTDQSYVVDVAKASDAELREELARSTPVVLGRSAVHISGVERWLAPVGEEFTTIVARTADMIIGELSGVVLPMRLREQERRVLWMLRGRVHPAFQRRRVGLALARALSDHFIPRLAVDSPGYVMARENEHVGLLDATATGRWPATVLLLELDCMRFADVKPLEVEWSDFSKLDRIRDGLNTLNEDLEGFVPYSHSAFGCRLNVSPKSYGVASFLWGGDVIIGAAVGCEIITAEGGERYSATGVLDWGCPPGGGEQLVRLLGVVARRSLEQGDKVLSIALGDASPLTADLDPYARRVEQLGVWTTYLDASEIPTPGREIYVDRFYL